MHFSTHVFLASTFLAYTPTLALSSYVVVTIHFLITCTCVFCVLPVPFFLVNCCYFNAFFFRLGYINMVADEFSSVLSILPYIQNAPDRISSHIH